MFVILRVIIFIFSFNSSKTSWYFTLCCQIINNNTSNSFFVYYSYCKLNTFFQLQMLGNRYPFYTFQGEKLPLHHYSPLWNIQFVCCIRKRFAEWFLPVPTFSPEEAPSKCVTKWFLFAVRVRRLYQQEKHWKCWYNCQQGKDVTEILRS